MKSLDFSTSLDSYHYVLTLPPPYVLLGRPDWMKSLAFGAPLDIWYDYF